MAELNFVNKRMKQLVMLGEMAMFRATCALCTRLVYWTDHKNLCRL